MLSTVEFSISQVPPSGDNARAVGLEPTFTVLETAVLAAGRYPQDLQLFRIVGCSQVREQPTSPGPSTHWNYRTPT